MAITITGKITQTGKATVLSTPPPPEGDIGVFVGGLGVNIIEYIAISTLGGATYFGDLTLERAWAGATSNGLNDQAVDGGGSDAPTQFATLDWFTITSPGNATAVMSLTARHQLTAGSNGTGDRGVFCGGLTINPLVAYKIMDYVTISTKSVVNFFGNLTDTSRAMGGAMCNDTKIIFKMGLTTLYGTYTNVMEVITVSTTGNAVDFGDAATGTRGSDCTSNDTGGRGIIVGGQPSSPNRTDAIEWVNISVSTGNGTAFGTLSTARRRLAATSNGAGDRGVFGGGDGDGALDLIEYITISTGGAAEIFGELAAPNNQADAVNNGAT